MREKIKQYFQSDSFLDLFAVICVFCIIGVAFQKTIDATEGNERNGSLYRITLVNPVNPDASIVWTTRSYSYQKNEEEITFIDQNGVSRTIGGNFWIETIKE